MVRHRVVSHKVVPDSETSTVDTNVPPRGDGAFAYSTAYACEKGCVSLLTTFPSNGWRCVRGRTTNGVQPTLAPALLSRVKFLCRRKKWASFADLKRCDGEGELELSLHKDIEAVPYSGY